jgi:hypothetical protein
LSTAELIGEVLSVMMESGWRRRLCKAAQISICVERLGRSQARDQNRSVALREVTGGKACWALRMLGRRFDLKTTTATSALLQIVVVHPADERVGDPDHFPRPVRAAGDAQEVAAFDMGGPVGWMVLKHVAEHVDEVIRREGREPLCEFCEHRCHAQQDALSLPGHDRAADGLARSASSAETIAASRQPVW